MFLAKKKYLGYLGLILLGFFFRYFYSSYESYWFDEQISFFVANPELSFQETLARSYNTDLSPVLYNLILKYYFILFSYSPDLGRYLSITTGTLGIIFLSLISFEISKHRSLMLVLFLAAFNIYLITYSAETRPYATIFFLSGLNIFLFFRCFISKSKNLPLIITFLIVSILTLLIHPFTILIIFSQIIFIILYNLKNKNFNISVYLFYTFVLTCYIILGHENLKIALSFRPLFSFLISVICFPRCLRGYAKKGGCLHLNKK